MQHRELMSEWLANWSPSKRQEVGDRRCRGLVVRAGPSGAKTFWRYEQTRDPETGKPKRKRVKLGRWSLDGGGGTLSLSEAREQFLTAREEQRAEVDGTRQTTVEEIAKEYRRAVLSHREHEAEAWNVIRVHVVEARPDPKREPFGKWPAREVRPRDVAAVVEHAKERRRVPATTRTGKETTRRLGGVGVARVVLRDLKGIFARAVETGDLDASPAVVARARTFGLKGSKRGRWLNAEEIAALFAALDLAAMLDGTARPRRLSETVRLGLALLLYVPVRSHSLIGARWEEMDLEAARWVVPVERLKLHKDARVTARPFTVPLSPTAVAILKRLREEAGDSPWVLASPSDKSEHIDDKALVRALGRLQVGDAERGRDPRLAFTSRLVVHDLRRSWRAWADELGVPFDVAERSLGHVLPGVADVYARGEMVERRAEAAALVGAAFDRIRLGTAATVVPLASAR